MGSYSRFGTHRLLSSIERSFELLSENAEEALGKLEAATTRISALGKIHLGLANTLIDAFGIPKEGLGILTPLPAQIEAISSAERAVLTASGLFRPVTMSLRKSRGEIAKAIEASRDEALKLAHNFDTGEMEVLARRLNERPEEFLNPDEQEEYRNKVRQWSLQVKDVLE